MYWRYSYIKVTKFWQNFYQCYLPPTKMCRLLSLMLFPVSICHPERSINYQKYVDLVSVVFTLFNQVHSVCVNGRNIDIHWGGKHAMRLWYAYDSMVKWSD